MPGPNVAIIVPVLDEAELLRPRLEALSRQADELIVSDGGSHDGSQAIARSVADTLVEGPAGRGPQLNAGAAAASSDILLFVHADTDLPESAVARVRRAVSEGAVGGAFFVRFDDPTLLYRIGERVVNLRTRLTRCPLGDQAQFVRRETFESLGGFEDWPILEDLEFMRRLGKAGRLAFLDPPVTTAARRYAKRGIPRTLLTNWAIWALYLLGVSPLRLGKLYRHVR